MVTTAGRYSQSNTQTRVKKARDKMPGCAEIALPPMMAAQQYKTKQ